MGSQPFFGHEPRAVHPAILMRVLDLIGNSLRTFVDVLQVPDVKVGRSVYPE
ncbi:hypothetical protein [Sphingobacterium spiritivorum]|uniref:hypothetical protein n=1 Tax=Sphingobacterium spiritivorum TaxID=258 RepID=UPI003DA66AA2